MGSFAKDCPADRWRKGTRIQCPDSVHQEPCTLQHYSSWLHPAASCCLSSLFLFIRFFSPQYQTLHFISPVYQRKVSSKNLQYLVFFPKKGLVHFFHYFKNILWVSTLCHVDITCLCTNGTSCVLHAIALSQLKILATQWMSDYHDVHNVLCSTVLWLLL